MSLYSETLRFHYARYAPGPATAADKNRGVKNHEYWGVRTSYHPNEEQIEAMRDRMKRIAKMKR